MFRSRSQRLIYDSYIKYVKLEIARDCFSFRWRERRFMIRFWVKVHLSHVKLNNHTSVISAARVSFNA